MSYGGDSTFDTASGSVDECVSQASTSTTLSSSSPANASTFGQAVTFTANVSALSPGSVTPTGTVTFAEGTTVLGTATLDGTDQATFTTSALSAGTHSITAVYGGDGNFTSSTSGVLAQSVKLVASTVVSSNQNPSLYSQPVTLTVQVTASGGGPSPTGTVTFLDGTTSLGTAPLSGLGPASLTTSALGVGPHSITAPFRLGSPTGSTGP